MLFVFDFRVPGHFSLPLGRLFLLGLASILGGVWGCGSSAPLGQTASEREAVEQLPKRERSQSSSPLKVQQNAVQEQGPASYESSAEVAEKLDGPASLKPAMPSLRPTTHEKALRKLGLDPLHLPQMESLTQSQRYQVMELISSSLGLACDGCHEGRNFKKSTLQKDVARFMWNEMTASFRLREGALFCDSCHQGTDSNLKREDQHRLEGYMRTEYVGKLLPQTSGAAVTVECSTCHGEPFIPEIFATPWKLP